MPNHALSTMEIRAVFAEEILDAGGTVSDTFDDGVRLFTRSVLPWLADVRPKDRMQGGVALKANQREISVHPYLFRMVCRNGAIRAQAVQTRRLENTDIQSCEEMTAALREAVRGCCVEEVFTKGVDEVRLAADSNVDLVLSMLSHLSHLPSLVGHRIFGEILSQFFGDADRSRFALMNAVTSVARETRDPELRWRLEELGGGIPASRTPSPFDPTITASLVEREEARHSETYEPVEELTAR